MSLERPRHWAWDFLRPVNLVSLSVGVLSIAYAAYTYHQTSDRPQLSWSSLAQIVFDQHNATSVVTLLDAEGHKVTENAYASQITVWNSGNRRFDNVDDSTLIREPLTFRLTGTGHIISAAITNTRNDTNGGWSIKADQKTAVMTWRHFDPGAATRILILYTGDEAGDVKPEIAIAGYSVLRNIPLRWQVPIFEGVVLLAMWLVGTAFAGYSFSAFLDHKKRQSQNLPPKTDYKSIVSSGAGGIVLICLGLVIRYLIQPPAIPAF